MAKLPSTQMYPGDWFKDPALRLCSPAARGIWADMLMLMFEAPQRGVFRVRNGAVLCAVSIQNIAKSIAGAKPKHILELIDNGVARVARKDGAIYSKRLIRDELKRRHKAQAGSKGGKQTSSKPQANPQAKRGSSSSTSSSTSKNTTPYSPPSDLLEDPPLGIGGAGPPPDRKRPVHTISVEVIEKIRALIAEWEKAGGRFVQHPTKDDEALGGQIIEKMLKPGCRVEDIMGATQADMKAAEQIYLTYRMADLTKSVTSRGKHLTLGHLKAALLAKRERAWEAKKREEKREAEVNTAAAGLLTLKTLPAEAEIWRQWRGLPLTDRQTRIAKWHNEEAAMKEWQEQKG